MVRAQRPTVASTEGRGFYARGRRGVKGPSPPAVVRRDPVYRRAVDLRRLVALALLLPLACRRPRPPAPPVVARDVTPALSPRSVVFDAGPAVTRDAAPDVAPDVRPDATLAGTMPATEPPLPDATPMQPGCFAWSPRRSVAACLVGQSGSNLNEDTEWAVRFSGEAASSAWSLVPVTDAGWFEEPHRVAAPPEVRARLRARFAAEGFVDLESLRRIVSETPWEWAPGATVRAVHRRTFGGGANAAERATDRLELRWQPNGPRLTLTAWEDRPVGEPRLRAYAIPGGRYLLLDAVGEYADEGEYGVHSLAWLCDRESRACR